jgi:hypothetical protein
MAMPLVPSVEINRIARQKLPHAPGKALRARPHQQMKMILHERPGIHPKRAFLAKLSEPRKKVLPIRLPPEYSSSLNSPPHHMM